MQQATSVCLLVHNLCTRTPKPCPSPASPTRRGTYPPRSMQIQSMGAACGTLVALVRNQLDRILPSRARQPLQLSPPSSCLCPPRRCNTARPPPTFEIVFITLGWPASASRLSKSILSPTLQPTTARHCAHPSPSYVIKRPAHGAIAMADGIVPAIDKGMTYRRLSQHAHNAPAIA